MTRTTGCGRLLSILVGTLLIVGWLGPIPPGLAQQPEASNLPAVEVRILQRGLLGRYIEDLDFVPNGPLARHIVMLVGYEVHGVSVGAKTHAAVRKLIDLRQQILGTPHGIAYIPSERLFALVDAVARELFFVDHRGTPHPSRPIKFLNGDLPDHIEGLAYLPATSPRFPDHLLTVTWKFVEGTFLSRIPVIQRDGQVVAEIPLPDDVAASLLYGVAFLAPDRLVVTDDFNRIWTLDFDGNVVSDPISTELLKAEGVVQLEDGRVVTGEGAQLRFYDAALDRLPQDDRDAGTSIGLVNADSVAWNPDTWQHLILGATEESGASAESIRVAAVPLSLDASSLVVDLGVSPTLPFRVPKATYLPDEHRIAVSLRRRSATPAQIALYDDDGTLVETIDIPAIGGLGRPSSIDYIPPTREFVVVEPARPSELKILTRTGSLARAIDLASIGVDSITALAYFNPLHPSGGQFLVIGSHGRVGDRAVITDFHGSLIGEFDPREELGFWFVADLSAITIGPLTVAFAALESASTARLVTFLLR
jgi:hypothetical protein